MATFSEIEEVRLSVKDPYIFIDLTEESSLPTTAVFQTAHKLASDGVYYATTKSGSVVADDYSKQYLYTSDATLSVWIDADGVEKAKCKALTAIIASIGGELRLQASGAGAERMEFTTLKDRQNYYKALLDLCNESYNASISNNSGSFGTMKQPEIAGGNL